MSNTARTARWSEGQRPSKAISAASRDSPIPRVDDHLTPISESTTTLQLSDADAEFLTNAVKRLPTVDESNSPITVDLNGAVSIRAKGPEDQAPTEIVLSSSHRHGDAVRFNKNRDYRPVELMPRPAQCSGRCRAQFNHREGSPSVASSDSLRSSKAFGGSVVTPKVQLWPAWKGASSSTFSKLTPPGIGVLEAQ